MSDDDNPRAEWPEIGWHLPWLRGQSEDYPHYDSDDFLLVHDDCEGLDGHDVKSLARYLMYAESETLHPVIRVRLVELLVGNVRYSSDRLAFTKHPDMTGKHSNPNERKEKRYKFVGMMMGYFLVVACQTIAMESNSRPYKQAIGERKRNVYLQKVSS